MTNTLNTFDHGIVVVPVVLEHCVGDAILTSAGFGWCDGSPGLSHSASACLSCLVTSGDFRNWFVVVSYVVGFYFCTIGQRSSLSAFHSVSYYKRHYSR